tara:strand:+ start:79 stop:399 length:321 start_codon:yes stop_codon:yes gene_type:complete
MTTTTNKEQSLKTAQAFDKIQNLQWESDNWTDKSPFDLFKQIIRTPGFKQKDLLMIGEALLVFGHDDVDKERVETYLSTLNELDELYNTNYEKYEERSKETGISLT